MSDDLRDHILAYCDLLRAQGLSPVTIKHYREYVKKGLMFPGGILALMGTLTGKQWGVARAAFDWYARFTGDRELSSNLRMLYRPRKDPRRPIQIPTIEEWRSLGLRAMQERAPFSCILWLQLYSGMRIGDILELENFEIREAASTGRTTMHQKGAGHTVRRDWIPGPLCQEAVNYLAQLSLAPDGLPNYRQLYQLVHRNRDKAEQRIRQWIPKPWHPHTFRHAVPSYLRSMGHKLEDIASITGHVSLDTLQRYYIHVISPHTTIAAQADLARMIFGDPAEKDGDDDGGKKGKGR